MIPPKNRLRFHFSDTFPVRRSRGFFFQEQEPPLIAWDGTLASNKKWMTNGVAVIKECWWIDACWPLSTAKEQHWKHAAFPICFYYFFYWAWFFAKLLPIWLQWLMLVLICRTSWEISATEKKRENCIWICVLWLSSKTGAKMSEDSSTLLCQRWSILWVLD